MSTLEYVTETIPRRAHYWWCHQCDLVGQREPRLDFAYNAGRVHLVVAHG